jgi:hypothetical protein
MAEGVKERLTPHKDSSKRSDLPASADLLTILLSSA